MRFNYSFILALVVLTSCQKHRLEGEMETLVGTWSYVEGYVIRSWYPPNGTYYIDTVDVDHDFQMTFKKKGKLILSKDGECFKRYRILDCHKNVQDFNTLTGFYFPASYNVDVKDKELGKEHRNWEYETYYYVNGDTLMTLYWPDPQNGYRPQDYPYSGPAHHNIFVRE